MMLKSLMTMVMLLLLAIAACLDSRAHGTRSGQHGIQRDSRLPGVSL